MTRSPRGRSPWQREVDDVLHGVAGAFLFGVPLLYTMEVWWKGNFTSPLRMLVALGATYVALVVIDAASGFRRQRATTTVRLLSDAAEGLALGLMAASVSLLVLRLIGLGVGLEPLLGRIVHEAVPFSIGVGIANGLLRAREEGGDDPTSGAEPSARTKAKRPAWRGTFADAGATVLGATIIALAIAPTDEVPMIAAMLTGPWLLGLIFASLAVSYVIVFEASFSAPAGQGAYQGVLRSPLGETAGAYLVSLLTGALMLWLFQLIRPGDPLVQVIAYVIVLGLPATIGGAAGRLAV